MFNFKKNRKDSRILHGEDFCNSKAWHDMCVLLMLEEGLKKELAFLDKKYGENGKVSMYEILYTIVFKFNSLK